MGAGQWESGWVRSNRPLGNSSHHRITSAEWSITSSVGLLHWADVTCSEVRCVIQ